MQSNFSIYFFDFLYVFNISVPLNFPDFRRIETSLWWSERSVSKALNNLNRIFLLVSIRSIHVGLLD